MKIAVIVDNGAVQRFALDALNAIEGIDEIAVFSCTNTRLPKRWLKHGAYYALNFLSVRNRLTRFVSVASGEKRIAGTTEFASESDGAWQRLPPQIVAELRHAQVILKFGMGLLRVPPADELPVPILSYHHGDPDRYRGRPAGFWEISDGAPVMGQVVQVIGDRLDAGEIVATCETKVFPWSYRATLIEAYRHSPLIINTAIRNALAGRTLAKERKGRNCRLPSNGRTIAFTLGMAGRFARRLLYGGFVEKAWNVSTASVRDPLQVIASNIPSASEWQSLPIGKDFSFYADPFYSDALESILVEALNKHTRRGEIVSVSAAGERTLIREAGHLSYPATARIDGKEIIVPECASWSAPRAYLAEAGAQPLPALRMDDDERVTDPTLLEHGGRIYLFGNPRSAGANVLHLWSAVAIDGEFKLHPASPIRISPEGSRMGGSILDLHGRLIRFGQDFSRGYGDGLVAFEIDDLTPQSYSERKIGTVRFGDPHGPHTLNFREGEMLFDWYSERLSLLAGFRRISARMKR